MNTLPPDSFLFFERPLLSLEFFLRALWCSNCGYLYISVELALPIFFLPEETDEKVVEDFLEKPLDVKVWEFVFMWIDELVWKEEWGVRGL